MKKHLLSTTIVVGALFFGPTAFATNISITDTWSVAAADHTSAGFIAPTFTTATTNTSNDSTITPIPNGAAQTEVMGVNASNWLFAVIPGDTGFHVSYGDFKVTFTLADGVGAQAGSKTFSAYMEYYANAFTQQDDMQWAATQYTSPSSTYRSSGTSLVLNETLSNGSVIQVTLPYEQDWNMAQAIQYDVISGPTAVVATPEPVSMAVLGVGLAGLGYVRRQRRPV